MTNPKNRAAKPRRPFAVILCCSLFLALTAAFFLPLEVVLLNQKEFLFPFGTVWIFQLLIAVIGAFHGHDAKPA